MNLTMYLTEHFASDYSLLMSILDFIPVILFLLTGVILIKAYNKKENALINTCIAGGTVLIFMAGFLKATWKMIISLNVCDFEPLNKMFLPCQAIGFIMLGFGLMKELYSNKKINNNKTLMLLLLPFILEEPAKVYQGTMIFIMFMVVGELMMVIALLKKCIDGKKYLYILMFILAFFASMMMGAMDSISSCLSVTAANWIEESINVVSQGGMFLGVYLLNKHELL